jgi:hypothetical protein
VWVKGAARAGISIRDEWSGGSGAYRKLQLDSRVVKFPRAVYDAPPPSETQDRCFVWSTGAAYQGRLPSNHV